MPRTHTSKLIRLSEGLQLRNLRKKMGMTVREFASEFYVGIGSISHWENGERTLPGPMLRLLEIYNEKLRKGEISTKKRPGS